MAPDPAPHPGVHLKLSCPDDRLRSLLEPIVRVWSQHSGAKVELRAQPLAEKDGVDVAVIAFPELGTWAARDELLPIPGRLHEPGHPLQWSSVLSVYRSELFSGWGSQTYGIPLAAEGHVILYRADRWADLQAKEEYRKRFGRALSVPATWEEFADAAAFFTERDKRPAWAISPRQQTDLFLRVAASYDRPLRVGDGPENAESLAFQFRLDTGQARIDSPGFVAAGQWLAGFKTNRVAEAEPISALEANRAVLAVVSLAELMKLKRAGRIDARFDVAPLPGTRSVVSPATGTMTATPNNTVPFIAGGWVGIVRRSCPAPEAAFDLLAELGGPARSEEIIAAGGYGPLRDSHLEADRLLIWLGYGLDDRRSRALQEALRSYVGKSARNPAYNLRTPDQAPLRAALSAQVAKIAAGEVSAEEGLKRVAAEWNRPNASAPFEKLLEWRRRAAGLD